VFILCWNTYVVEQWTLFRGPQNSYLKNNLRKGQGFMRKGVPKQKKKSINKLKGYKG
jgi:hypothetical protein